MEMLNEWPDLNSGREDQSGEGTKSWSTRKPACAEEESQNVRSWYLKIAHLRSESLSPAAETLTWAATISWSKEEPAASSKTALTELYSTEAVLDTPCLWRQASVCSSAEKGPERVTWGNGIRWWWPRHHPYTIGNQNQKSWKHTLNCCFAISFFLGSFTFYRSRSIGSFS